MGCQLTTEDEAPTDVVNTVEELEALPDNTLICDSMGDYGLVFGRLIWYPDTNGISPDEAAHRCYLPAHVVFRAPADTPSFGVV